MDITGIGALADFAGKLLDKVFPDPAARDAAKLALFQAQQAGELKQMEQEFEQAKAQIGVNAVEAASSSPWVAGWRPGVGWVGALALFYVAIIEPMARFVATVFFHYAGAFPAIDTTITMQVLLGMLGMGGLRSFDKLKGTSK